MTYHSIGDFQIGERKKRYMKGNEGPSDEWMDYLVTADTKHLDDTSTCVRVDFFLLELMPPFRRLMKLLEALFLCFTAGTTL